MANEKISVIEQEQATKYKELYEWVLKATEEILYDRQEFLFVALKLLDNKPFIEEIMVLRKKLEIPSYFYNDEGKDLTSEDWEKIEEKRGPLYGSDSINKMCLKYDLDPFEYGEVVIDYLYLGSFNPHRNGFRNFIGIDEFKYKARLIHNPGEEIIAKPGINTAFLQMYRDTTPNKLISFIKANKDIINRIRESLYSFPIKYKFDYTLKQDLIIYLLHKQKFSSGKISKKLANEFHYMDIADSTIRQTIKRFKLLFTSL